MSKIDIKLDEQGYIQAGSVVRFESSNFKEAVWHGNSTMDVEFHSGWKYRYYGCPPVLWEHIQKVSRLTGASLGKALYNELIAKKDIYPYERIA
jgi:hypothetical protein